MTPSALACAGLLVCVCGGAGTSPAATRDQQAHDDEDTFEQTIIKSISAAGRRGRRPGIDYRERSPLVIPPTSTCRRREASAAARNPAWPRDAGPQARRQAPSRARAQRATSPDSEPRADAERTAPRPIRAPAAAPRRRDSGSGDEADIGRPVQRRPSSAPRASSAGMPDGHAPKEETPSSPASRRAAPDRSRRPAIRRRRPASLTASAATRAAAGRSTATMSSDQPGGDRSRDDGLRLSAGGA